MSPRIVSTADSGAGGRPFRIVVVPAVCGTARRTEARSLAADPDEPSGGFPL
ncbi:MAG: hypothetical protein QM604_10380 [Microbacterium sp.]